MTRFVVGIDLGTTNTALAFVDTDKGESAPVEGFEIPQVVQPGQVEARSLLPSAVYLASEHELPAGSLDVAWDGGRRFAVGAFAQGRGAEVPGRLVSSAKSWLSAGGVDRGAAILPLEAPEDVVKLSPPGASARVLEHVRDAWNHTFAQADESARLERQEVFLTVPASFDAVARELTLEAAEEAGLEVTLLEEPTAACYAWIAGQGDAWRKQLAPGDLMLVCDVGGGTTDFSLIEAADEGGSLELRRVAVGEHILLGGDNMDLALAYAVAGQLAKEGHKLDAWQMRGLGHACRAAKEQLLGGSAESVPLAVLGRGSKVIGGTLRADLTRALAAQTIVEGFFPRCAGGDRPAVQKRSGLRELGLPYAADAAITRHLAGFLAGRLPTAVLWNGGVMKSQLLRGRLVEVLGDFGAKARVLEGTDLDRAVAHGAAYYGLVKRGKGVRIRGGVGRTYYVGIEAARPAIPGAPPALKALCVVPFGLEEGERRAIPDRELGLVVGEPAEFRILSSTTRRDEPGVMLDEDQTEELSELAPVEVTLPADAGEAASAGRPVPVTIEAHVTELGALELWCKTRGDRRYKLEWNLRSDG